MKIFFIALAAVVALAALVLTVVVIHGKNNILDGPGMVNSYAQITQDEAKEMMSQDDGHVIVDVRRVDEYESGHIPGAICIPNESIGTERPGALPDLKQVILVYCRSGRRSKEAAQKLFDMGYANVYEFGGIIDWTGDIVMENTAKPSPVLVIEANGTKFYATLEDNVSAAALTEKLSKEPLTLTLDDYGGFEKVGDLPWRLPTADTQITTEPGDVILYQGDKITVYYDENSWSFTRLAKIGGATKAALLSALGEGSVSVTFSVEWSE